MSNLADAAAAVASQLASPHLGALASAYRGEACHTKSGAAKVAGVLPSPHRPILSNLHSAWAAEPDTPGSAIALALEAAASMEAASDRPDVQVVVTGPDSPGAPVRLTSEVVRRLIDDAEHRVMLVSYAAYQIDSVVKALERAVQRGVVVELVLESGENLDGGGGAKAYAEHTVYEWPPEERHPPGAKLHAKAVIIDSRDVLLTSANMTKAAYGANIELGVLCRGGTTAKQVHAHFDGLIATGVLRPRDVAGAGEGDH
ncbi:MAG: DISARM system phospholipase D-like protein DrmC [Acidimicrobiales bacterium]